MIPPTTRAERDRLANDAAELEQSIAREAKRLPTIRSRAHRAAVRVELDSLRLRLADLHSALGMPS